MTGSLYVGAISGTSVDGLDLAVLEVGQAIRLVHGRTVPLPDDLRAALLRLGQPGRDDLDLLGRADCDLGRFIGAAALKLLRDLELDPADIQAIGSHGQTVRHRPDGNAPFTLQIGDPNRIAEATGITTVADFRRRDMAAGGQGAPLVPPFHAALFRSPDENRAVLNIGGIANLTALPSEPTASISGFDTGPGNGLMDAWIAQELGRPFDDAGIWAASGEVDEGLLQALLADPYLDRAPPKSTGREHYNLSWLASLGLTLPESNADTQATLCAFTVESIANAIRRWAPLTQRLLVCGGGRLNKKLMQDLAGRTGLDVEPTEAHGVNGDSLEAAAFAWLASQTLTGKPGNEPAVSGAAGYRVLGAIYPA